MVIARSADAVTVVVATDVLLPGTGSAVVDATDAVLDSAAAWAGAVTTTVIVGADAPLTRAARVQVTETFPVFEQAQPAPVAETNVTPAGKVSETVSEAASEGPLLSTSSEYETAAPATTVAGPVLVILRSADAVTVVPATEVLLPGVGSAVVEDTEAVLDSAAAWLGAVTTTVIAGAVAPVTSAARVQLTDTLPVFVHVQPVPAAETNVTPAGMESVTVTEAPSEGPLLTTDRL